jgi:hypothetical protein
VIVQVSELTFRLSGSRKQDSRVFSFDKHAWQRGRPHFRARTRRQLNQVNRLAYFILLASENFLRLRFALETTN